MIKNYFGQFRLLLCCKKNDRDEISFGPKDSSNSWIITCVLNFLFFFLNAFFLTFEKPVFETVTWRTAARVLAFGLIKK
jgi:hypothetical protein